MPLGVAEPLYFLSFDSQKSAFLLEIRGDWPMNAGLPPVKEVIASLKEQKEAKALTISASSLGGWGSTLAAFLLEVEQVAQELSLHIDYQNFPSSLTKLLRLASAVSARDNGAAEVHRSFIYRLGVWSVRLAEQVNQVLVFLGSITQSFARLFKGEHCFRARDFWLVMQQCGADALPIVTLISFLVGLTMAFVGAIQLTTFGASIYVANLVGLAMVREMGAMMAGIILCGRTGAAFASQIGSMKVSEEIDALQTLGIQPVDFIVLPRIIALFLMMPLLALYADFIGILGGLSVGMTMLDLSFTQYVLQTQKAISFTSFSTGIIKSTVFGALVAITGCLKGMQCGSNASAVGAAATAAVVSGITSLVVADSVFAFIFHVLDI